MHRQGIPSVLFSTLFYGVEWLPKNNDECNRQSTSNFSHVSVEQSVRVFSSEIPQRFISKASFSFISFISVQVSNVTGKLWVVSLQLMCSRVELQCERIKLANHLIYTRFTSFVSLSFNTTGIVTLEERISCLLDYGFFVYASLSVYNA